MFYPHLIRLSVLITLAFTLVPFGGIAYADSIKAPIATTSSVLDVYKSPTCGCCEAWITHLESAGFHARIHHPDDLNAIKNQHRISPQFQSCHTAISAEGYVFEGHIPAWVIAQFLAEKPERALGLAVPGMPVGSPGMEMGDRFSPYDVLLLNDDGSSTPYIRINSLQESI